MKLEGLYRHASTHAAGIVIGDRPLIDLVPLYRDPRSALPVTQFNMKWVEQAGLVKFDFLGLKTLTVLDEGGRADPRAAVSKSTSPRSRSTTQGLSMLARGETVGVFQVEGAGMRARAGRHAARPLRGPDRARRALSSRPDGEHPGLLRAEARQGEVDYIHPMLEPILTDTYGVITYQEQVHADRPRSRRLHARRGRSPAPRDGQEDQRRRWTSSASASSPARSSAASSRPTPTTIFDACAKFADYGFNKSHSAPYALITYQTAYLKANYPGRVPRRLDDART